MGTRMPGSVAERACRLLEIPQHLISQIVSAPTVEEAQQVWWRERSLLRMAWKHAVMCAHPDAGGSNDQFYAVQSAWDTVQSPGWPVALWKLYRERERAKRNEKVSSFSSVFDLREPAFLKHL